MQMTRLQVAELLLNMNEDGLTHLKDSEGNDFWVDSHTDSLTLLMNHIIAGHVYRIKDNAVKEVTAALLGNKYKRKNNNGRYGLVVAINTEYKTIEVAGGSECSLKEFNERWQLVED